MGALRLSELDDLSTTMLRFRFEWRVGLRFSVRGPTQGPTSGMRIGRGHGRGAGLGHEPVTGDGTSGAGGGCEISFCPTISSPDNTIDQCKAAHQSLVHHSADSSCRNGPFSRTAPMVMPSNLRLMIGMTSVRRGMRAMPEKRKMAASRDPKNKRAPVVFFR